MSISFKSNRSVVPLAAAVGRGWCNEAIASLQLAALLGLLWLGLFGGEALIFGGFAVVGTVVFSRTFAPLQRIAISPLGLLRFAVHFVLQSLTGGVDVAYRALHPRCPVTPATWRYSLRLPPGQARLLFIGCIGLIPGTVGRAVEGDQLWVHSIAGDPQKSLATLERRVADLYGIRLPSES